ncbi:MAG: HD domain-containing protein, partial [Acidobacteriaceae bacterium]
MRCAQRRPAIPISESSSVQLLRVEYQRASEQMRETFAQSQEGEALVRSRTELVDSLIERLWLEHIAAEEYGPPGLALTAIGGYGRRQLFPYSDIDLLFIACDAMAENSHKSHIRKLSQDLWDIGLRVSATTRTLAECERISEENPEFTLSLLDRRYIAGDFSLFEELDLERVPTLVERRRSQLFTAIANLAHARHGKFQRTLFHLEPNVKDGLGGLRDFQTCVWLGQVLPASARTSANRYERDLLIERQDESARAHQFLIAVRSFLHYRSRRDDNMLYWQAQEEAAARRLGLSSSQSRTEDEQSSQTAGWMRQYFRHARSIEWLTRQMLDEIPSGRPAVIDQFRQWRSRAILRGCPVADGKISLKTAEEYTSPERVLTLFELMAEQPLQLTREAEGHLSESLAVLAESLPEGAALWGRVHRILLGPEVANALRTMHAMGILELILPEFHGVDALVVRDAYHRYTVDEHTFLILENLHSLARPNGEWEKGFASILRELEEPELLYLAALLHDTGKARGEGKHTEHSASIAEAVCERWHLTSTQQETVLRLIRNHLEMSLALRKDIFDAETVRMFAEVVGTPENLRLLTLLTYSDVRSVNPEALTPWKAENLWRLYMATSNYLDRNVDADRIEADADTAAIQRVISLSPKNSAKIHGFLAGLPQRYLRTRGAEQILGHWQLAEKLAVASASVALTRTDASWECTLVTRDRPFLFADVAGALTAWGMDIIKADAFSNAEGTVIDHFRFLDRYETLALNPAETERFQKSLTEVAGGLVPVERLLAARAHSAHTRNNKTRVETRLSVDNTSSTHSTILQVIAQDTPGLLRRLSLVLAQQDCDISVA